ncbi:MBL fold metallo-hydrolase [Candidatus Poriferisocius sp.]|uniref:MBL fold metallo-hydrolase n=1 Tax=Candidatus Poriferisocius sp. TaxID=3101276 RepID=UPI003B02A1F7
MELVPIGTHLYACLQPDRGLGWSNSGFVAAGGGLVVDTLYDQRLTAQMADLYAEVHPETPARVVNTHHNGDHCWGNKIFENAEIIAHTGCAERFDEFTPAQAASMAAMENPPPHWADVAESFRDFHFDEVELVPPNRVIDGDLHLDLGGLEVEIRFVGPAHTAGDLIVSVPDQGVVFAGDVVFHLCTPIGWEGTQQAWVNALEDIEAMAPETVVAGHGPLCDAAGVRAMREYLEYVWEEASAHHAAGRTASQACQSIDPGQYASWNEPWRLAYNVHRAYKELDGGAWDDLYDTGAAMADAALLREQWAS